MERQYITTDMSLRELARMHDVGHSLVMVQSRRREWVRKREEYRAQAEDRAVALMAGEEGVRRTKEARVRDNAIEAIDEAITKLRTDMKRTRRVLVNDKWVDEPVMTMRPGEIVLLIDRLNVLFGKPSNITEERSFGVNLEGGVSADVLQRFVDATRGLGAGSGAASESPIPRTDRTREN